MVGSALGPILQIVRLRDEHVAGLCDLLAALAAADEARHFQPHPFDRVHVAGLADAPGKDLYYVVMLDTQVAGYGLLRGWNEGYEIPSLGIAVHPACRGRKIGNTLMQFLHAAAGLRGSRRVRLRVVSTNTAAIRLYEQTGYRFDAATDVDDNGNMLLTAYKELEG